MQPLLQARLSLDSLDSVSIVYQSRLKTRFLCAPSDRPHTLYRMGQTLSSVHPCVRKLTFTHLGEDSYLEGTKTVVRNQTRRLRTAKTASASSLWVIFPTDVTQSKRLRRCEKKHWPTRLFAMHCARQTIAAEIVFEKVRLVAGDGTTECMACIDL